MKGLGGQVDELAHAVEVVKLLVALLARLAVLAVKVCQDARAARVQPVPGVIFAVALCESRGDGFRRALVVGGVGCVCNVL